MKKLLLKALFVICTAVSIGSFSSCKQDSVLPLLQLHPDCNGTVILKYASFADVQNDYNQLKTSYDNAVDEQPLIDFENRNLFYSLRKKNFEMDEGLIPDDPTFDAWHYSSDEVISTLLNKDGLIIIDNELYAWSDGCLGFKAPFDCNNYQGLVAMVREFHTGSISDLSYHNYLTAHDITVVDLCSGIFDFESNYDGYAMEGSTNRSDCTLETSIGVKFLSNNPITKIAEIELTAYNLNTGIPILNTWYLNNVGNEVTIIGGSDPSFINQLWNNAGGLYVGSFVRIKVDYQTINFLDIYMIAANADRSCFGYDALNLDLVCPILLNAQPLNASLGQWKLSIEGLPSGSVGLFEWDFGDGTLITSSNLAEIHNFPIPCAGGESYTVSIKDLEGTMPCNFPLTKQIYVRNPCFFNSYRVRIPRLEDPAIRFNGKRVVLLHKIRPNGKIKSRFYHRVKGKTIEVINGDLTYKQGNNCQTIPLATLMQNGNDGNPATHNKKRRLKQRYKDGTSYYFDASNTNTIRFSANDGYSRDFQISTPCLSVQ